MTPIEKQSGKIAKSMDRLLFDLSPEPVWLLRRADLRILDVNQAASERFGYSREQYLAMTLPDFHSASDINRLRAAAETGDSQSSGLRGWKTRTSRGDSIDTDLAVRFFRTGKKDLILVTALDMRARTALEERIQQAGKMEAIGMLAGGIAHDFNNLLTIISGYSQLLLNSVPFNERSSVEQVLKASERAAELTGQLLTFSRRQKLQPQALDVNVIVSEMSTMLRRLIGEHIELKLSLAKELGAVHADPGHIDQVIMNLAVNARDAMANGGKLLIETCNFDLTDENEARRLGVRLGHYVMLAVNDTGMGMDEKTRTRVFDPFFTTKDKGHGTGLGLSTVYSIVKQSGGAVDLYSELLHGTSVKVLFPRVGDVCPVEQKAEAVQEPAGGGETILVVEDEAAVRRLVRATLERRGYRVLVAASGPEALDIHRRTEHVDLLLTDLIMPQMSGMEVADAVLKTRPTARVLFMSGYTDLSLQQTEALPQETEFLQKPFTPNALAARVREVLDGNGRDESRRTAGFHP